MNTPNIKPVEDLYNKFNETMNEVTDNNPVFLTEKGFGEFVLLTMDDYNRLTEDN